MPLSTTFVLGEIPPFVIRISNWTLLKPVGHTKHATRRRHQPVPLCSFAKLTYTWYSFIYVGKIWEKTVSLPAHTSYPRKKYRYINIDGQKPLFSTFFKRLKYNKNESVFCLFVHDSLNLIIYIYIYTKPFEKWINMGNYPASECLRSSENTIIWK